MLIGASSVDVEQAVATPIEQQVNGVDNSIYLKSINANDGTLTLRVSFEVGTDLDTANVLTQNRVSQATASLPMAVQEKVMAAVVESLRPGGTFATFAYLHALYLPNARRFRQRLESAFANVEVSPVVWMNLPPAFVYRCTR